MLQITKWDLSMEWSVLFVKGIEGAECGGWWAFCHMWLKGKLNSPLIGQEKVNEITQLLQISTLIFLMKAGLYTFVQSHCGDLHLGFEAHLDRPNESHAVEEKLSEVLSNVFSTQIILFSQHKLNCDQKLHLSHNLPYMDFLYHTSLSLLL